MADLSSLLEQSKQLINQTGRPGFVMTRSLDELSKESKKLVAKAGIEGVSAPLDAKAQLILAQKGLDAEKLTKNINSIDLARTFESLEPLSETDVEGYLRHEHEMIVVGCIEEGQREAVRQFEDKTFRAIESDWERTKRQIFEELGHQGPDIYPDDSNAESSVALAPRAFIKASSIFSGSSVELSSLRMHSKMKNYATAVANLNEARNQKNSIPVIASFKAVAEKLEGKWSPACDAWDTLSYMLNESASPRESQYASAYRSTPRSRDCMDLTRGLVFGARNFLEKQYYDFVRKTIEHHPERAKLGGKPGIEDEIKAFLRVRTPLSSRNLSTGNTKEPFWALLYYLLRCGKGADAEAILKNCEVRAELKEAMAAFNKKQSISQMARDALLHEFKKAENVDPFKAAVYKVLGRCEIQRKTISEITETTEDYIWLQHVLISENEDPADSYTLSVFQKKVLDHGPNHFNSNGANPFKYFHILLLTAQFERAVEYLSQQKDHAVLAVHVAIALAYYGLLRAPDQDTLNPDIGLATDSVGQPTFNFERMIYRYTRSFYRSDPEDALHYLFLLCLGSMPRTVQEACHIHIQEVVLDTRQFSALLGEARTDRRDPGFVEKYARLISHGEDPPTFMNRLIAETAERSRENDRLEDAVHLYNLCGAYDEVIRIVIGRLGESLTSNSSTQLKTEAEKVLSFYKSQPPILPRVSASLLKTCQILVSLVDFFFNARSGKDEIALQIMEEIMLLPLDPRQPLSNYIAEFAGLDQAIKKNTPDIIVTTMDLLCRQYAAYQASNFPDKQRKLTEIKRLATNLQKFLGGIRDFQMPKEVFAYVTQKEILLMN